MINTGFIAINIIIVIITIIFISRTKYPIIYCIVHCLSGISFLTAMHLLKNFTEILAPELNFFNVAISCIGGITGALFICLSNLFC